jgi:hemerythrin-like metal-binding protein
MEKIRWSRKYSSGLIYLDNHRRNFIDIINELIDVCNSGTSETRLPMVFHRLAFYVEDYFTMKELAIRDSPTLPFMEYKKEHQRFTAEISRFQERFRMGETGICEQMRDFLVNWFENYIRIFGPEAAAYMKTRGYE